MLLLLLLEVIIFALLLFGVVLGVEAGRLMAAGDVADRACDELRDGAPANVRHYYRTKRQRVNTK